MMPACLTNYTSAKSCSKTKEKPKLMNRLFKKDKVKDVGRRDYKTRRQVIEKYVQKELVTSKKVLLWREPDPSGELDSSGTSEESTSTECPAIKSVRFSSPLVQFQVEIESSWDIYPGPCSVSTTNENRYKTKATLLEDVGRIRLSDLALAGYDPNELLKAQPKELKFLSNEELTMLRNQKERLLKYRKQLKRRLQKPRRQRCQTQTMIANHCVQAAKHRQDRIIANYKMAAPTAQEHRRRRAIKFALARAASVVVQLQQKDRLLQQIRQAADQRDQRRKDRRMPMQLPHLTIRHQMRRIVIHQATMEACLRLQRKNLKLHQVTGQPTISTLPDSKSVPDDPAVETSDNDNDDDDWSLDTDDFDYRRLEWAVLSYLAAAKSRQFRNRQVVPVHQPQTQFEV